MAKTPREIVREIEAEAVKMVELLPTRPNVTRPDSETIRSEAQKYGTQTSFGNYNFVSTVKNRSAALTVYLGRRDVEQKKLNEHQKQAVTKALAACLGSTFPMPTRRCSLYGL